MVQTRAGMVQTRGNGRGGGRSGKKQIQKKRLFLCSSKKGPGFNWRNKCVSSKFKARVKNLCKCGLGNRAS